jgi:hypothetical protein
MNKAPTREELTQINMDAANKARMKIEFAVSSAMSEFHQSTGLTITDIRVHFDTHRMVGGGVITSPVQVQLKTEI